MLAAGEGPAVLDIGCAGGLDTEKPIVGSPQWAHAYLRRHAGFTEVWGLDYDGAKIKFLHEHGYPDTVVGDAQDFSLDRRFNTVFAGEIIEHLARPGQFLQCAARHLEPGGRIVLTTPYAQGIQHVLYAWLRFPKTASNPEHLMWFCPSTLSVLAAQAGLAVKRVELIMDFPPRAPSRFYRLARRLLIAVAPAIPMRIKANTMLAVLVPA
jgi:SAM-dependent methyltransferase